jgi:hypothetical protein
VRLTRAVVGILAEDDDFDLVEGAVLSPGEHVFGRRVDGELLPFPNNELVQLCTIVTTRIDFFSVELSGKDDARSKE